MHSRCLFCKLWFDLRPSSLKKEHSENKCHKPSLLVRPPPHIEIFASISLYFTYLNNFYFSDSTVNQRNRRCFWQCAGEMFFFPSLFVTFVILLLAFFGNLFLPNNLLFYFYFPQLWSIYKSKKSWMFVTGKSSSSIAFCYSFFSLSDSHNRKVFGSHFRRKAFQLREKFDSEILDQNCVSFINVLSLITFFFTFDIDN